MLLVADLGFRAHAVVGYTKKGHEALVLVGLVRTLCLYFESPPWIHSMNFMNFVHGQVQQSQGKTLCWLDLRWGRRLFSRHVRLAGETNKGNQASSGPYYMHGARCRALSSHDMPFCILWLSSENTVTQS